MQGPRQKLTLGIGLLAILFFSFPFSMPFATINKIETDTYQYGEYDISEYPYSINGSDPINDENLSQKGKAVIAAVIEDGHYHKRFRGRDEVAPNIPIDTLPNQERPFVVEYNGTYHTLVSQGSHYKINVPHHRQMLTTELRRTGVLLLAIAFFAAFGYGGRGSRALVYLSGLLGATSWIYIGSHSFKLNIAIVSLVTDFLLVAIILCQAIVFFWGLLTSSRN